MKFEDLAKTFAKKELPESEVELTGSVPAETIGSYRDMALAHIAEHLELPGFRPGKVPKDMALKKVGDLAVLEEAVELFVKDFYPELVEVLTLDVVGRPDIRITKLAPNNPVELTLRVSVYPEVNIPKDWKELHTTIKADEVLPATHEEVAKTLETLQKNKASAAKAPDGQAAPLPELNDEFAKSLGAFENLDMLKAQIKEGITEEKARAARDARRGKLIEALLEKVKVSVPRVFIESELEKIMAQMRDDVARFGMSFEDYLKRVEKTEQAVRNDFREQATKRAKLQLALNKIATDEKLEADPTAVEAEFKHAMEHFPDANPELVRIHIDTVLRNEQALKILEGTVANAPAEEAK